jgi:lipoprotein-anchoring transpeptidase ErfK/SrfK
MKKIFVVISPLLMSTLLSANLACSKKVSTVSEEVLPSIPTSEPSKQEEDYSVIVEKYVEAQEEIPEEEKIFDSLERIDCICTTGRVNIREDMSTSSDRITQVDKGYTLELLDEYDEWYQVKYNNRIGYISKKYATRVVGYQTDSIMENMVYVEETKSLRDAYSNEETIKIPAGEVCEVYDQDEKDYLVSYKGNYGLISKDNVTVLENTFVVIDIYTQTLKVYVNNELLLETFVVTGKDSTPTYCGFFRIREKEEDVYWPEFKVKVDYWMPFNRGEGMHDASWRKKFGSDLYKEEGSHGCVNIPKKYITTIYDNVEVGTPVLVKR